MISIPSCLGLVWSKLTFFTTTTGRAGGNTLTSNQHSFMGFLKRIFSIGSKKGKKRPHIVHNVNLDSELRGISEEEEHEANVGRLLRSSSARFAVVSEIDYTSLPPLRKSINPLLRGYKSSRFFSPSNQRGHSNSCCIYRESCKHYHQSTRDI